MRQVDHGRLCIRQLSFVCSLMFLILAVMFFKQTFWRRRILGLRKYEYGVSLLYICFTNVIIVYVVFGCTVCRAPYTNSASS